MTLSSADHEDLMAMFEKEFSYLRLDRENKDMWPRQIIYQNGEANSLFLAYRRGVAYGQAISR